MIGKGEKQCWLTIVAFLAYCKEIFVNHKKCWFWDISYKPWNQILNTKEHIAIRIFLI